MLFELNAHKDSACVSEVISDPKWLLCFVRACDCDAQRAATLARQCCSGQPPTVAYSMLFDGLLHVLPERDSCGRPILLVRVGALKTLLRTHSFEELAAAAASWLKERLRIDPVAQRRGVTIIQDLVGMDAALVLMLMKPKVIASQLYYARYFSSHYPLKFGWLATVDAPQAFSSLWSVLSAALPEWLVNAVRFLNRPQADKELASLIGVRGSVLECEQK